MNGEQSFPMTFLEIVQNCGPLYLLALLISIGGSIWLLGARIAGLAHPVRVDVAKEMALLFCGPFLLFFFAVAYSARALMPAFLNLGIGGEDAFSRSLSLIHYSGLTAFLSLALGFVAMLLPRRRDEGDESPPS